MLGDEEEKKSGGPLNPLKKAMKRRNTKTVQFTAPTYKEPSDNEYSSSEEEEGNSEYLGQDSENSISTQSNDQAHDIGDNAVVEPLKPRSQTQNGRQNAEGSVDQGIHNGVYERENTSDDMRTSDDIYDRSGRFRYADP